jgi:hypothetical protein
MSAQTSGMDATNKGVTMNQREATVNCILSVLEERGVEYELNGPTPISEVLTQDDKKNVRSILFTMFQQHKVDFRDQARLSDTKYMTDYISGLVNNWIRKAPEFNSDAKYQAKNPGSRQGTQDEQVREMRKLLSTISDPSTKAVIQSHIDNRLAELKPSITVNLDLIPESLRHLIK